MDASVGNVSVDVLGQSVALLGRFSRDKYSIAAALLQLGARRVTARYYPFESEVLFLGRDLPPKVANDIEEYEAAERQALLHERDLWMALGDSLKPNPDSKPPKFDDGVAVAKRLRAFVKRLPKLDVPSLRLVTSEWGEPAARPLLQGWAGKLPQDMLGFLSEMDGVCIKCEGGDGSRSTGMLHVPPLESQMFRSPESTDLKNDTLEWTIVDRPKESHRALLMREKGQPADRAYIAHLNTAEEELYAWICDSFSEYITLAMRFRLGLHSCWPIVDSKSFPQLRPTAQPADRSFTVTCFCGKRLRAYKDQTGKKGRCPACHRLVPLHPDLPESAEIKTLLAQAAKQGLPKQLMRDIENTLERADECLREDM